METYLEAVGEAVDELSSLQHTLSARYTLDALTAAAELLDQAIDASDTIHAKRRVARQHA